MCRTKQSNEYIYRGISRIFDPIVIGVIIFVLAVLHYNLLVFDVGVLLGLQVILPYSVYVYGLAKGRFDADVSKRKHRVPLLIIGVVATCISLGFVWFRGYDETLIPYSGMLILFAVFAAITRFWKISGHVFIHTILTVILATFVSPWFYLMVATTLPLVVFVRVQLKKHTWGQVFAGALLGFGVLLFL